MKKFFGSVFDIEDYTTQFYGDYNKPFPKDPEHSLEED